MRRYVLALVAACVFAAVIFPASASAGTWVVKSPSSTRLGKVVATTGRAKVYYRTGARWGGIEYTHDGVYAADMYLDGDTGARKHASISRVNKSLWLIDSIISGQSCCTKRKGRWVDMSLTKPMHAYGSVSGECPAWAAAGAIFILSNRLE